VQSVELVTQFPKLNRKVLVYVIKFLRLSILPAESVTLMNATNLALIFGANLLRNPENDPLKDVTNMPLQAAWFKNILGMQIPFLLTSFYKRKK